MYLLINSGHINKFLHSHFSPSLAILLRMEKTIKGIRDALGMNQAEFADALGVHVLTVSRWERKAQMPTSALVKRELSKLEEKAKRDAARKQ